MAIPRETMLRSSTIFKNIFFHSHLQFPCQGEKKAVHNARPSNQINQPKIQTIRKDYLNSIIIYKASYLHESLSGLLLGHRFPIGVTHKDKKIRLFFDGGFIMLFL